MVYVTEPMNNVDQLKGYLEAILPWLTSKNNFYLRNSEKDFIHNKFSIIANDIPIELLEVEKFYVIEKLSTDLYNYQTLMGMSEFSKLIKKSDQKGYMKEFYSALCKGDKSLILKYIKSLQANQILKNELISEDTKMLRQLVATEEDIASIDINDMQISENAFNEMVEYFLQKYKKIEMKEKFIYIPGCYKSIFSSKNFMFEIKNNKYLYSVLGEKINFYGYTKFENNSIKRDLIRNDHSIGYIHDIAYFDFINTSQEFQKYILHVAEISVEESKQNFLFWILDTINYYFFDVIFLQQNYVINRYLLTASNKRPKMTVKDVLTSILQRFEESKIDQMYVLGTHISRNSVVYLIDWIESNKITIDANRDIREQLSSAQYYRYDEDTLLINLLYRLFWKVPLKESVKELILVLQKIYNEFGLEIEHGRKKQLTQLFFHIFDVSTTKTTGDRKFLNKLYIKDLKLLNETQEFYISRALKGFDMMHPNIIMGFASEEEKSSFLKKG